MAPLLPYLNNLKWPVGYASGTFYVEFSHFSGQWRLSFTTRLDLNGDLLRTVQLITTELLTVKSCWSTRSSDETPFFCLITEVNQMRNRLGRTATVNNMRRGLKYIWALNNAQRIDKTYRITFQQYNPAWTSTIIFRLILVLEEEKLKIIWAFEI